MKRQQAAISLSLVIHGALLLMLFGATSILSVTKPPILLTFDLVRPDEEAPADRTPKPKMETSKKNVRTALPKPSRPEQTTHRTDPLFQDAPLPLLAAPSTPLQPFSAAAAPTTGIHSGQPAAPGPSTTEYSSSRQAAERSPGGQDHAGEAARQGRARYLKEHFEYIRIRVLGNIDYPDRARRMNWEGTVLVSFIVTADGRAENINILQSSGFPILDRNVVGAIRRSVPFPKPPVSAQIVIPIIYSLK